MRWRALLVAVLHAAAIALFARGFLLTKTSLTDTSPLSDSQPGSTSFDRVVFIVVDALRYDFAVGLPSLEDTLARHPDHSVLFRFRADAPTTTLQRLKALMTGTLPTFIEAGANFASWAVTEDSLVGQWHSSGRRIAFLGDDTWLTCFPGAFSESHGFPSFDVWDLDTVDAGVRSHLLPMLTAHSNATWDILIAHLLGVDHAGHRYGRAHPELARKLSDTDALLRDVIAALPPRTLLAVLGDHGMTESGDHGGETDLETDAALFLYQTGDTRPLQRTRCIADACASARRVGAVVNQIDLVPTLALLTGVPIPFSSVGNVIASLFETDEAVAGALRSNARQMRRYLHRYSSAASAGVTALPAADLRALDDAFERAERASEEEKAAALFAAYVRDAAALCRASWAQFDVSWMAAGVAVAAAAAIFIDGRAIATALKVDAAAATAMLVVLAGAAAVFASNSFVAWEDSVTAFLLQSALVVALAIATMKRSVSASVSIVLAIVLVRWTTEFSVCREEQGDFCTPNIEPEAYGRALSVAVLGHGVAQFWAMRSKSAAVIFGALFSLCIIFWEVQHMQQGKAEHTIWDDASLLLARIVFASVAGAFWYTFRAEKRPISSNRALERYAAVLCLVQFLSGPFAARAAAAHLAVTAALLRLPRRPPLLAEVALMLSAQHFFFRAGHQATLSSIQWWPGFLGLRHAHVIVSGVLVTASFFGYALLMASADAVVLGERAARRATMGGMLAVCLALTAHFRRHLMLWKLFAPRFVVMAIGTLIYDVAALIL